MTQTIESKSALVSVKLDQDDKARIRSLYRKIVRPISWWKRLSGNTSIEKKLANRLSMKPKIPGLYQYIFKQDELSALRAVQTIYRGFSVLEKHPKIGRPLEDEPWLREKIIDFGDSW